MFIEESERLPKKDSNVMASYLLLYRFLQVKTDTMTEIVVTAFSVISVIVVNSMANPIPNPSSDPKS